MDPDRWSDLYDVRDFEVPVLLEAPVVHGFKRGSKELGIPTANLDMEQLGMKGEQFEPGIYFGWSVLHDKIYQAVVSVGWNPFYKNEIKTIEAYLMSELDDFYGETIKILICGYLRQEANFSSLEDLISCIHSDINLTKDKLLQDKHISYIDMSKWPNV
eukprot:CAMPEP_0182430074 /NCGR_PEP_ID=MMETSP1167-20130531/36654_1 /TAXON_ID=2988 /ORGANISM="Mallomonas Sp, Strain CCMP3275" /LENGTH=158 /DNA_ID=CAMNT_0024614711 /DNA_START=163 /DNA_END=639 /DNA_ORIENTATION=-